MRLTEPTTADCWMFTAIDDDIYEVDSQTLTLYLGTSLSDTVLTDPSTATITVMDDEGMIYLQSFANQ